jgi:uridine kinase
VDTRNVPFVIAVSGISGAGKTSVITRAVQLLGNARALHFDDYRDSSTYPADLSDWAARGADVDEWKTPQLAADLRALRADPALDFILVEEPFGRMRAELADLIDFAVHLDVPGDVLLVRRLLRRLGEERHLFGDQLLDQLHRDLHEYLAAGRELVALGAVAMKEAADFVLDGTKTVDEIATTLVIEARHRAAK